LSFLLADHPVMTRDLVRRAAAPPEEEKKR